MIVNSNCFVSLTYELRVDGMDGKIVEKVSKSKPLEFVTGLGSMLPKFEHQLQGLTAGDKFSFKIESNEAYGPADENSIVDIPLSAFEINGQIDEKMLQVGYYIPMRDEHGNRLNGLVTEINQERKFVRMDFNHPMADEDLFFSGEILEVREARPEDLESHGCGCGSGGCGSSEGEEGCGCDHEHGHDHDHHHDHEHEHEHAEAGGGCGSGRCGC